MLHVLTIVQPFHRHGSIEGYLFRKIYFDRCVVRSFWRRPKSVGVPVEGRCRPRARPAILLGHQVLPVTLAERSSKLDRKSTRLNSSHGYISYAVFCLKKKKNHISAVSSD